MENRKLVVKEVNGGPSSYRFRLLLPDILQQERSSSNSPNHSQDNGSSIACIASYQSNLYVGTTSGKLLHYHHFEDAAEYMLISELQLSTDKKPVNKVLILPNIERALILTGTVASVYTLPELTPCHIGKIKDTNDVSILAYSIHSNADQPKNGAVNDKIVAFTSNKIRIVQIDKEQIKLLKDINYSGAISGISTASGMSSNYSNLVLVANQENYDIIDLKMTRKIPLFDYTGKDQKVPPHIVSYIAEDKDKSEEYLLTIKNDESTSLAMFINSLGDVTRGTLSWIGEGYPTGGVIIQWPLVFGVFNSATEKNRLILSSLKTLEIVHSESLEVPKIESIETDKKGESGEEELEQKPGEHIQSTGNEESINEPEQLENSITPQAVDDDTKKDNEDGTQVNTLETIDSVDTDITATASKDEVSKEIPPPTTELTQSSKTIKILKVPDIQVNSEAIDKLLSKINLSNGTTAPPVPSKEKTYETGNILLHDGSNVWILYPESEIIGLQESFKTSVQEKSLNSFAQSLESKLDTFKRETHLYVLHMLIIALFESGNFSIASRYLLRIKNGKTLIDPMFVIYMLSDIEEVPKSAIDITVYSGVKEAMELCTSSVNRAMLVDYLDKVFPDLIDAGSKTEDTIRIIYYASFSKNESISSFLEEKDEGNWKKLTAVNQKIIDITEKKSLYRSLVNIYRLLKENDKLHFKELSEKLCGLTVQLLNNEKVDDDISKEALIEDTLKDLKANPPDESLYTRYLIEILKVDKVKGFNFMKSNNISRFKAIHKSIMDEISENYASEVDFSLLKIEFLESSYKENISNIALQTELTLEMTKLMASPNFLTEEFKINFEILKQTFKIENNLTESQWPKISWIDFLHLNSRINECKDFIILYLKVYELLLVSVQQEDQKATNFSIWSIVESNEIFWYYGLILPKDGTLQQLLDFSDYNTAEFFAVNNKLKFPRNPYYFEEDPRQSGGLSIPQRKDNLLVVLDFYLKELANNPLSIFAIRHFISTFGNSFFSPSEILKLLPDHIPLSHISDYLTSVVIDIQANSRETLIMKSVSKADSVLSKQIYTDLANGSSY
ncbi:uncharacterized protein RJT20DRAFT_137139 [Scheffersomyces xylosifermentans]|uniref:uncharacterized protein n=1 Tax=Scheffersomyces xylosifermentans TaxID=1304137 RepID=UPI00315D1556